MFSSKNNLLLFKGKSIHPFPDKIEKILLWNGRAILIYIVEPDKKQFLDSEIVKRNVCSYDETGNELWKIEYRGDYNKISASFIGLAKKDEEFWAYRSDGWDVNFDPSSGKIIQSILGR